MFSLSSLSFLQPKPQSVPYREALSNRRILTSSTESREGLTQQVCVEKPSYLSPISLCFKSLVKIVSPSLDHVKNMLHEVKVHCVESLTGKWEKTQTYEVMGWLALRFI